MKVKLDTRIREICPNIAIGVIRAKVENSPTCDELWDILNDECNRVKSQYELLAINKRRAIAATRNLYKQLGKDPNRYRVSSEALCRRAVKGMELYRINTLVDLVNLISMRSGYAIGGFDAHKIVGNITLGVGEKNEQFEAIGRGILNIEGLPIYRDEVGGIGTPTSDEERTKMTLDTSYVHLNINAFEQEMPLDHTMDWSVELLKQYASATDIITEIIK